MTVSYEESATGVLPKSCFESLDRHNASILPSIELPYYRQIASPLFLTNSYAVNAWNVNYRIDRSFLFTCISYE